MIRANNRLVILSTPKKINLETTLKCQLFPIPTALFEGNAEVKYLKAELVLKATLEAGTSSCCQQDPHTSVIDLSAMFLAIEWPKPGTVVNLMEAVYEYIKARSIYQDVYFVSDRYWLCSTKGSICKSKIQTVVNHCFFLRWHDYQTGKALSSSIEKQLIDLVVDFLCKKIEQNKFPRFLVITK